MDDFMVANDTVRTQVQGMIKNVEITDAKFDGEIYTITGRIKLDKVRQSVIPHLPKPSDATPGKSSGKYGYTGVILDCRGLPLIPAMTSVAPTALANDTAPPAPILTVTRLGMVCPAAKFTFDAFGTAVPAGYTVTKLLAVPFVTVTFITTASAVAGIPSVPPVIINVLGDPAASVAFHPPVGPRDSSSRVGDNGWK